MQTHLAQLHDWLVSTVPGVIFLGALGSVVGSILFAAARVCVSRVRWARLLRGWVYRHFARQVAVAQTLRKVNSTQVEAAPYLFYVLGLLALFIVQSTLAFLVIGTTVAVAIVYGLGRPIILVIGISLSVPLALDFFRALSAIVCLTETPVDRVEGAIKNAFPKRLPDRATEGSNESSAPQASGLGK